MIAGFKPGMTVLTPSGKRATVKTARKINGREKVTVSYYGEILADRVFDASALRPT